MSRCADVKLSTWQYDHGWHRVDRQFLYSHMGLSQKSATPWNCNSKRRPILLRRSRPAYTSCYFDPHDIHTVPYCLWLKSFRISDTLSDGLQYESSQLSTDLISPLSG